mmetsp:Transcript_21000/g.37925  ORF Transcript_21000/g.37925 Transcript_21000/m.37925 type:complete len:366 (-) Transcript_21000:318-1415(-)|eukprot:CAMPEP_0198283694 /NCGR_PEP_ID=MMETSP1449-20131203/3263_1 /TAXON_ID=420275 /ORGANISM="Attheya septentrionalis, Strain CCMP2084" /LENGTH=365 /DNA_ID=CAMNT_0043980427 /DNA_START=197 /DNA_END=1294 /DNA_ORIENTATION=+
MRGFRVAVGSVGVAASCWLGLCLPVVEGQRPTPGDLVTNAPMVMPLDPVTDAPVGVGVTPAPLAVGTTAAPTIAVITTSDPTLAPTRAPSNNGNGNDPNGSTGVYSQTTPKWDGCNDPNTPGAPHVVKRGDPTTVCLTLGPNGNWGRETPLIKYFRLNFQPEADEYSRFQIPNSYTELVVEDILSSSDNSVAPNNITVFSASGQGLTFLRQYYDRTNGWIFPHLTAIIDVQKGVVTGIAWDDACVFCDAKFCEENTFDFAGMDASERTPPLPEPTKGCYKTLKQCKDSITNGGSECDLTLHVVWTGTDVDGNVMSSSSSRFSAFPPNRIQERAESLIPAVPKFPTNFFGGGDDEDDPDANNRRGL